MIREEFEAAGTGARLLGNYVARGAGAVRTLIPETIKPASAGVGVGAVWGGIVGIGNLRRYGQGKMTGKDAVLDTAGESAGLGLAAGLGILAGNAVRASVLLTGVSALAPFVAGVVVTAAGKILWDKTVQKHL